MQFPTGGTAHEPQGMIRCDSEADSIVWMREGVYGIFVMLFFDAYTLEGKPFRGFTTLKGSIFL